jgi:hypothetical protein
MIKAFTHPIFIRRLWTFSHPPGCTSSLLLLQSVVIAVAIVIAIMPPSPPTQTKGESPQMEEWKNDKASPPSDKDLRSVLREQIHSLEAR